MDIDLLSKMVKELILDNDRVALPGLGSFVAEIVPSTFSDKGYTINPPYRRLSFRSKPDDGDLLVRFYATSNGVGMDVARRIIVDFVAELKSVLHSRKMVVFPGLGRLRATRENNVFFVADENLDIYPDGFGLRPVSLKNHIESKAEVAAAVEGLASILVDNSEIIYKSDMQSDPAQQPEPDPVSQSVPESESELQPDLESVSESEPESVQVKPSSDLAQQPEQDPASQSEPDPVSQSEPDPVSQSVPESESELQTAPGSVSESEPKPVQVEPSSDPAQRPEPDPVSQSEPESESELQPAPESVSESEPEPVQVESTSDPAQQSEQDPVSQSESDPVSQSVPESESELQPEPESVSESEPKPVQVEPSSDPAQRPEPDPVSQSVPESVIQPTLSKEPGKKTLVAILVVLGVALAVLLLFMIMGRLAPELVDKFLYSAEELEILNYQFK